MQNELSRVWYTGKIEHDGVMDIGQDLSEVDADRKREHLAPLNSYITNSGWIEDNCMKGGVFVENN